VIYIARGPNRGYEWSYYLKVRSRVFSFTSLILILTRGVSYCGLAIYIQKNLKAKEE
jgi:hypothetical protein